ncbi:MAG: hypothetical protein L3J78_01530 [Thermoplasmata archaeon]|nr:hypothetical protein [Thermoplasmata archaeon]
MRSADPGTARDLLTTPLAALLSIGLLYSLGPGVTAHASEFDFFLTADLRPRQYLAADLAFQFVSLLAAGGLAAAVAAVGMVVTVGRPAIVAVPMFLILAAYAAFVLLTSQVLVILRIRHPRWHVRAITIGLIALSLLPSIAIARPEFPIRFDAIPFPSSAFAGLGIAVLRAAPPALSDVAVAAAFLGVIGLAWAALSDSYIVHGLRPTMTAGFGQMDLGARMEMQRRLIGGLGGVTTRVRLRTDRGGETSLMTRFHLVRIWRDGSVLFIVLFALIAILPAGVGVGRSEAVGSAAITVTQTLTFLLGILAMNWAFYERENLWIVLTAAKPPGAYFRGLMLSFAAIGLAMTSAFLGILATTRSFALPVESLALPIASPVAAAYVATATLTRVKLKPSAFSFAALGIFFLVSVGGFLGGAAAQGVVLAARVVGGLGSGAQAAVLGAFLLALAAFGLWSVTRLAAGFRM